MKLHPHQKKLIGLILFLPALAVYIAMVLILSDYVPDHWLVKLIFYIIAGTVWAFPLKPLMLWMNKPA
ncbi:MAG: DUF2842 domain-containing protein [bacterium]